MPIGCPWEVFKYYVTPTSGQIQLQSSNTVEIPLPTSPSTLISGQIPPTYLPLDV
eukprot:Pgem_evm1s7643